MVLMRDDVVSKLLKHSQELSTGYGVASLFLFGSDARDEAQADSDVDLLVEFKQPLGLFEFIELQQKLEFILGCKVDLGSKHSHKSCFNDQVFKEAIRVA